jgi:radical SAM-linked protein
MAKLRDEKVSLSVSSLRAYGLNDDLLAEMATMRAGGLTFAPEAGTQRMRDVITKNVTEDDIIESAHRVFSRGFHRMKLYFMIGLPTETDEDVRGIVETAARVQAIGRRYQAGATVTASVSTHVPKPHTPFQWCAMDSEAETARKQKILAETAQRLRVDLKMHENLQSHLEAIFSRGDRDTADVLERAFRLGCRFDSWDEQLRMDLWDQAIEESLAKAAAPGEGLHLERYLGTIPVTSKLPWDHIDIALEPDFLLKEYRKAMKDRLSPPCGKPYKKLLHPSSVEAAEAGWKDKLICYDCGVACDLGGMKEERLYYLRRMNAWTPPVEAAPAVRPDATPDDGDGSRPARKKRQPAPPTRIQQSEPHRVRLRYTKLGRVAYLGHLDLVRHLPRIFRRAGVELNYSLGFHPKPDLSFGPALGLGIPSLGELLDVKLSDRVDAPELVRRLQAVTLDGIRWTGGVNLGTNDRALGRVIARAEFWAALPAGADVHAGLDRWRSGDAIKVKRQGEGAGVGRMIDVRRALQSLEAPPLSVAELALVRDQLGWAPEANRPSVVRFQLAVSTEGSAKPIEVLEGLWGAEVAREAAIARAHLWGDALPDGTLIDALDTEALRAVTLAAAAGVPLEAPAGSPPASISL